MGYMDGVPRVACRTDAAAAGAATTHCHMSKIKLLLRDFAVAAAFAFGSFM
jgi:hypothetical protein